MDSFILTLAIRWLPAVDALAASCVSREWHETLSSERQGGNVWKQVCRNTNPFVVDALLLTQHNNTPVDYRLLAVGFGRQVTTLPRRITPPTLGPADLFAVVDLYRRATVQNNKNRRVIEASWACPIAFPGLGTKNICMPGQTKMTISGANPYHVQHVESERVKEWQKTHSRFSQKSPLHYAAYDIIGVDSSGENDPSRALRAKVTLFRKDTMRSVCIMDEDIVDCATGGDVDPAEEVVRFYYHNKETLRFSSNEAGRNAVLLARKRIFSRLSLDGEFYLKAILPEPGSDEEYEWLANSRHATRTMEDDELYIPTERDVAAMSSIPSFPYEVKKFFFTFRVSTALPYDFWDELDSEEDMMIALEGLCWQ